MTGHTTPLCDCTMSDTFHDYYCQKTFGCRKAIAESIAPSAARPIEAEAGKYPMGGQELLATLRGIADDEDRGVDKDRRSGARWACQRCISAVESWLRSAPCAGVPCDMGKMCLDCQPRGPNGECPDAARSAGVALVTCGKCQRQRDVASTSCPDDHCGFKPLAGPTPRCDKHFAEDIVRDRGEKEITTATLSMLYFAKGLERQVNAQQSATAPMEAIALILEKCLDDHWQACDPEAKAVRTVRAWLAAADSSSRADDEVQEWHEVLPPSTRSKE